MNNRLRLVYALSLSIVVGGSGTVRAEDKPASDEALIAAGKDEAGFQPLFDGKSLNNWDGNPKFWSVRDGAIVGQTTKENPT